MLNNGIKFYDAPGVKASLFAVNSLLPTIPFVGFTTPTTVGSLEVMAVNSKWMQKMIYPELQTPYPFNDGIAYGSVAGDDDRFQGVADVNEAVNIAQDPTWFPYLALEYRPKASRNYSDGLVPLWSAAIPGSYGIAFVDHTAYPKNTDTINYVVLWLNNATLPLGNTLNGLWQSQNASVHSADGSKTWAFKASEMAPHAENDLYPQVDGIGRINPFALREINTATYTSLGSTSVTISWLTATDMDSEVKVYTQNSGSAQPVIDRHLLTPVKAHQISIIGLQPNTTYYYEVVSSLFNVPDPDIYVSSNPTNDPNKRLTFRTVSATQPLIRLSVLGPNIPTHHSFPLSVSNTGGVAHGFTALGVNFSVSGYHVVSPLPASVFVGRGQTQTLQINYAAGAATSQLLCCVNYQYGDDNGNTITGNSAWLRIY